MSNELKGVDLYAGYAGNLDAVFQNVPYTRAEALKGLNLNTLRLMGPWLKGAVDALGIDVSTNPNWDINLDKLLAHTSERGFKVMFYTLGHTNSDGSHGELGIVDPGFGVTPIPIETAKKYIDQLENSPNLHHNFITDPRIALWSIGNECPIGTIPTYWSNDVTLNSNYYWMIELSQYIRKKGGKTSFPHPWLKVATGGSCWRVDAVINHIDAYVDYLDWHAYATWELNHDYCLKKPVCDTTGDTGGSQIGKIISYGEYNWTAWEDYVVSLLERFVAYKGSHSLDQILISEFGIHHGYANSYDAVTCYIPWAFSDQDCINYFTHYFNALKRVATKHPPGLRNLIIHCGIGDGWRERYPDTFRFSLVFCTGEKRADYNVVAANFAEVTEKGYLRVHAKT
jgi:hypothetical protein